MSLSSYESSRFSGSPICLYYFRYGDQPDNFIAYTDSDDPFPFTIPGSASPTMFEPIPIDRGKVVSSGSLDKTTLTITTPQDSDVSNLYLVYPPSQVTTLIIWQGHVTDPDHDFRVIWTGRVVSCARKGSKAELSCQPISTALKRSGPRRKYGYGCPYTLYGEDCGAVKAAFSVSTTVVSYNGSRVSLFGNWPGVGRAAKYVQGIIEWVGPNGSREIRTILRAESDGTTLLLNGPVKNVSVGTIVSIALGCNHRSGTSAQPDGDCGPVFNNVQNFGGQERIPFKNPIGLVNNFY